MSLFTTPQLDETLAYSLARGPHDLLLAHPVSEGCDEEVSSDLLSPNYNPRLAADSSFSRTMWPVAVRQKKERMTG